MIFVWIGYCQVIHSSCDGCYLSMFILGYNAATWEITEKHVINFFSFDIGLTPSQSLGFFFLQSVKEITNKHFLENTFYEPNISMNSCNNPQLQQTESRNLTFYLCWLLASPRRLINLNAVSRILHHNHPCLIYDAIMKQISIIFSKNAAIFVYCQTIIKLQLLTFRQTFAKPCIVIAKNLH